MRTFNLVMQTVGLWLCSIAGFFVVFAWQYWGVSNGGVLPLLGALAMANAVYFGLPYWHLTEWGDTFLPAASSYGLAWINCFACALSAVAYLDGLEWFEVLYGFAQAAAGIYVIFLCRRFRQQQTAPAVAGF